MFVAKFSVEAAAAEARRRRQVVEGGAGISCGLELVARGSEDVLLVELAWSTHETTIPIVIRTVRNPARRWHGSAHTICVTGVRPTAAEVELTVPMPRRADIHSIPPPGTRRRRLLGVRPRWVFNVAREMRRQGQRWGSSARKSTPSMANVRACGNRKPCPASPWPKTY